MLVTPDLLCKGKLQSHVTSQLLVQTCHFSNWLPLQVLGSVLHVAERCFEGLRINRLWGLYCMPKLPLNIFQMEIYPEKCFAGKLQCQCFILLWPANSAVFLLPPVCKQRLWVFGWTVVLRQFRLWNLHACGCCIRHITASCYSASVDFTRSVK